MKRVLVLFSLIAAHCAGIADVKPQALQRFQANYGPGCNIAAWMPLSGRDGGMGSEPATGQGGMAVNPIPKAWKSSLVALGFGLSCRLADDSSVTSGLAKLNDETGLWEKDLDRGFLPPPPTVEERKQLDKATRVINVKSVNAQGYASVIEDTFGDEKHRVATMKFCLFHPPREICGYGVVGMLRDGRKGDLTPHALKIIRSIEFLPDEPKSDTIVPQVPAPTTEPASDVKP